MRLQRNSTCEVTVKYISGNDNVYVHRIVPKEHNREDYYKDNENYAKILKTLSKYK
ncbi:MAG: hypothetical protein ACRDB6_04005 [Cetobacterium sp.]